MLGGNLEDLTVVTVWVSMALDFKDSSAGVYESLFMGLYPVFGFLIPKRASITKFHSICP